MNKLLMPSLYRLALAVLFSSVCMLTAMGQNGAATTVTPTTPPPAKGIGPAPAKSKQNKMLSSALSPETRQTLQEAMNSYGTSDETPHPASK